MSTDNWILDATHRKRIRLQMSNNDVDEMVFACGYTWKVIIRDILWTVHGWYAEILLNTEVLDNEVLVWVKTDYGYDYRDVSSLPSETHIFKPSKNSAHVFKSSHVPEAYRNIFIFIEFFKKRETTAKPLKLDPKEEAVKTDDKQHNDEAQSDAFTDNLSKNLKQALEDGNYSDITIRCGSEIFRAHRIILFVRSPVFAAMFQNNMKEVVTGEVNIENVEPEVFKAVLTYIYTGEWKQNPSHSIDTVCGVLAEADKYMLSGLKKACVEKLRSSITEDNALEILVLGDLYDPGLKKTALQYVCTRYSQFKNSTKWKNLQKQNPSLIFEIMDAKIEMLQ